MMIMRYVVRQEGKKGRGLTHSDGREMSQVCSQKCVPPSFCRKSLVSLGSIEMHQSEEEERVRAPRCPCSRVN